MTISPIVHLDSNNTPKTLPDSHTWDDITLDLRIGSETRPGSGIPVIDLTDQNAKVEIRRACENWGAFQVTNHGVAGEILERLERNISGVFGLPIEQKMAAARPAEGGLGYGVPIINKNFKKKVWSEGFLIMGSPSHHANLLWPQNDSKTAHHFIDEMVRYQKEMYELSGRIMGLMIESLGLSEEETKWANPNKYGLINPMSHVQLNSYPACPNPSKAMGLVPHTDSSIITILYQSNGSDGLQVQAEDGIGWVAVHPIDGALVVFVSDLMHILSNGRFKSVLHRVVPNATRNRLSAAYFYGPLGDVEVKPLTRLTLAKNEPLMYRSVTWNELRSVKKTHLYNVLETFKIKR